jgi:hypothetical protein
MIKYQNDTGNECIEHKFIETYDIAMYLPNGTVYFHVVVMKSSHTCLFTTYE